MIGSAAHVSHILKVNLEQTSCFVLKDISVDLQKLKSVVHAPGDYHITLGQSSYFTGRDVTSRTLTKIPLDGDFLKSDFDYQQHQLSKTLTDDFSQNSYSINGIRITDNGFIILQLQASQDLVKIVKNYHKICTDYTSSCPTATFALSKHYFDPSKFDMHVTVAKLKDLTLKEKYQRCLQIKLNDYSHQSFKLSPQVRLESSYKKNGKHVAIHRASIEPTMKRMPAVLVHQFDNLRNEETARRSHRLWTVPKIKELIDTVFPMPIRITRHVGVIKSGENWKLTFVDKNDKIKLCKQFSAIKSGQKKGLCCYDKTNPKHLVMDEVALNTISQHAQHGIRPSMV